MTSKNTEDQIASAKFPWLELLSEEQAAFYTNMGYKCPIRLHGKIVAIQEFIFTYGIVVGMDECGYEYRYCYPNIFEALEAMLAWVLSGLEEPTGYIKRKG